MVLVIQVRTKILSVFVHAADGYLHIATEAIEMVQVFPQDPVQHRYGRLIDPYCFDNRETMGTVRNKIFWGCVMSIKKLLNGTDGLIPISAYHNLSEVDAVIREGYGRFTMDFTDETGINYAVVGPKTPPSNADWQATSFALSSQCAPISVTACDIPPESDTLKENNRLDNSFNCTIARGSPIDFSGVMTGYVHSYTFFNFHKYLVETGTSFRNEGLDMIVNDAKTVISNATQQEATQMFPNTWSWVAATTIGLKYDQFSSLPKDMIDQAWFLTLGYLMVVACNTTGKCPLLQDRP